MDISIKARFAKFLFRKLESYEIPCLMQYLNEAQSEYKLNPARFLVNLKNFSSENESSRVSYEAVDRKPVLSSASSSFRSACNAALQSNRRCTSTIARHRPANVANERVQVCQQSTQGARDLTGNRKFKCSICVRRYNWLKHLRTHLRRQHMIQHVTPREHFVLLSPEEAASTIASYEKNIRGRAYPNRKRRGLKSSSKLVRNDHTKKFKCSLCSDKVYAWRSDAIKHLKAKHFIAQPLLSQVIEVPVLKREKEHFMSQELQVATPRSSSTSMSKSKCSGPLSTASSSSFSRKVLSSMLCDLTGNMRFKCSQCERRTNWRAAIVDHLKKAHQVAKPLDGRDVILLSREEAASTIGGYRKSHGLRKPFKQPACSKFTDLAGTKKFKCGSCPFRSNLKSAIVYHLKAKHSIDTPEMHHVVVMSPEEAASSLLAYERKNPQFRRGRRAKK